MKLFNNSNKLTNWSSIQMKADKVAELNISGYIGIPEWWQFDPNMEKELISTKEKMQHELKEISNLKAETILVNIDSLGGDPNHAQAMRTALIKTGAKILINYTGWSASAATIINPNKNGKNTTMSSTNLLLIHQSRGCECGVASTMEAYAKALRKINDVMSDVYVEQTGKAKADVIEMMNINNGEGEWLTAEESLAFGLVGSITEPLKAAAAYDTNRLSKFGYKIPQNKLKTINMKFGKKEEPKINALAMQDGSILLHEGELKEGIELRSAGENEPIEKGDYVTAEGSKITVGEDLKIASIEAKVDPKEDNEILSAVAEMLVDMQEKFDAKIEELRKTGSKAKVGKINLTDPSLEIGNQATARAGIQKQMKEIAKKRRDNQNK